MLKTPRFLLTAGLALALAFTFSCSGDDGDSPPATLPSSSDAGVSQLPSSASAPSSSSEDATLSSSSHDEELVEVSSSSEEESSSSAAPPPYIPPYNPPYIPPVTPSSSSLAHCSHFIEGTEIEHYGMFKKKFCDKRDGHEYVYVTIGEGATAQTWMAENLNYAAEGSKCYDDDEEHCLTYGRLYDWFTAMDIPRCNNATNCGKLVISPHHRGICPEGWHIPYGGTQSDGNPASGWPTLRNYIQKDKGATTNTAIGYALKAKSDFWGESYAENSDDYGFSVLPAGFYGNTTSNGAEKKYWYFGSQTIFWMASITTTVSTQTFNRTDNAATGSSNMNDLQYRFYSVRCLKDD